MIYRPHSFFLSAQCHSRCTENNNNADNDNDTNNNVGIYS